MGIFMLIKFKVFEHIPVTFQVFKRFSTNIKRHRMISNDLFIAKRSAEFQCPLIAIREIKVFRFFLFGIYKSSRIFLSTFFLEVTV